ncbi:MAG: hypothetical protein IJQ78_01585, partial [Selenomonadaceae bacterium]|nr:hypothetical protein [Selenomonadaceae bacterium]
QLEGCFMSRVSFRIFKETLLRNCVKFSLTQTDGIWAGKMAELFFDSSLNKVCDCGENVLK